MMTPLARAIIDWVEGELARAASPPVLMVSGAQGIGKSTAMMALSGRTDVRVPVLGLDEFYLTRQEREALARDVHPLCETRGPPGTHDLVLLGDVLEQLLNGASGANVAVPRFDKRRDDRMAYEDWADVAARPDAIVLEGWLIGALGEPTSPHSDPVNSLEAAEDPDGIWRGWQERALAGDYARLWDRADAFLHLRAPSFSVIQRWRTQQEETTLGLSPGTLPPERRAWVARFIQHYERITRRMLQGQVRAGTVIAVDAERRPATR